MLATCSFFSPAKMVSLSLNTILLTITDILYYTIDILKVKKEEKSKAQPGTIRKAIEEEILIKDAKNYNRIKKVAEKRVVKKARVLQDQLYAVKLLPRVIKAFRKENSVYITKIGWLSRKDIRKAYGSIVVYIIKSKSAYIKTFKPRYKAFFYIKPQVCAKCAQIRHYYSKCRAVIPKYVPYKGPYESFSKSYQILYPTCYK
ncbi:hypothetical protein DL98DRAFT_554131 [Cadophora sp. DSE1049]|nr:hypothetical protein DL98DRAFT_554131 [Cadophora sp. DSE1049]